MYEMYTSIFTYTFLYNIQRDWAKYIANCWGNSPVMTKQLSKVSLYFKE